MVGAPPPPPLYHKKVFKISRFWVAISSLVFNKSLSNFAILLILRLFFQWYRRIFPNLWKILFPYVATYLTFTRQGNVINSLTLHANGRKLLVHVRNSVLCMLDLRSYTVMQRYLGASNFKEHIRSTLTACGCFVIAGSEDGYAYVWNTETGQWNSPVSCSLWPRNK